MYGLMTVNVNVCVVRFVPKNIGHFIIIMLVLLHLALFSLTSGVNPIIFAAVGTIAVFFSITAAKVMYNIYVRLCT